MITATTCSIRPRTETWVQPWLTPCGRGYSCNRGRLCLLCRCGNLDGRRSWAPGNMQYKSKSAVRLVTRVRVSRVYGGGLGKRRHECAEDARVCRCYYIHHRAESILQVRTVGLRSDATTLDYAAMGVHALVVIVVGLPV